MIIAHEGHDHTTESPAPQPTQTPPATQPTITQPPSPTTSTQQTPPNPSSQTGISPDILVGASTVVGIVAVWLIATYILKLSLPTKIFIVVGGLLAVGVTGYQTTPIVSVAALTIGMALILTTTFLQLKQHRPQKD